MLSLQSFEKSYGGHLVLQAASLSIPKGVYLLTGANGVGKSTLLKCLAGLLPFKGSIRVNNTLLKKDRISYRQKVNFAEAEPLFPEFLTGEEMITLFVRAKNGSNDDIEQLVATLNMRHYLQSQVGTYSSGMLKKLSLVLAFIGHPHWILLDEPFITLDSDSLASVQAQISQMAHHRDIGILFSSHQAVQLERLPSVKQIHIEKATLNIQQS